MAKRGRALLGAATVLGVTLTSWASYKLALYIKTQLKRGRLLSKYRGLLIPTTDQLQAIKAEFIQQLVDGLQRDVEPNGRELLQLPTYVTQLPTGHEIGDVYAIDLGGTNFRVMHVRLGEDQSDVVSQNVHKLEIPKEVYKGTGQALFDFLATALKEFIDKHHTQGSGQPGTEPVVGFCFSFPMKQSALDAGELLDWTKGFECSDVIGQDPVLLLSQALKRAGRPCRIVALLNDTVGVFAAHKYVEPSTTIGVIIGTGTNACYVERASDVTKWQPQGAPLPSDTQTAINVEWGAFDSVHLPRCPEDTDVDLATPHKGRYLFEKMLSGMYLGEVARRILVTISSETKLFGDFERYPEAAAVFARLVSQGSFTTSHLSAICMDESPMLLHTRNILCSPDCLGCPPSMAPYSTRTVVREVCELVAQRSAQLVAVALDAMLTHSQWDGDRDGQATIAFDGGVYEHFQAYQVMLWKALNRLRGEAACSKLRLALSSGGSCLGAAVLAAAAVAGKPTQTATVPILASTPVATAPAPITTTSATVATGLSTSEVKASPRALTTPVDALAAATDVAVPIMTADNGSNGHTASVAESAPALTASVVVEKEGEDAANGDDEAEEGGEEGGANGSGNASPDKPGVPQTSSGGGSSKPKKKKKKSGKK